MSLRVSRGPLNNRTLKKIRHVEIISSSHPIHPVKNQTSLSENVVSDAVYILEEMHADLACNFVKPINSVNVQGFTNISNEN